MCIRDRVYGTGANYGPSGTGKYGRGGSQSGSYNFLGMLQTNDNEFQVADEDVYKRQIYGVVEMNFPHRTIFMIDS